MDQAMMENYKFVWYVHETYLNHILAIKNKYKDRIFNLIKVFAFTGNRTIITISNCQGVQR